MNTIEPEFQNLLRGIHIRFTRFFILVLSGKHITLPQYYVLATLIAQGTLPMNRVAKHLHITKPAVTNLVDRLEKRKLITRNAHPKDRRIYLLELTDQGRNLVRAVQKHFFDFITHTLSKVPPKDRETIKRFYKTLTAELDRHLAHEK